MSKTGLMLLGGFLGSVVGFLGPVVLAEILWAIDSDKGAGGAATFLVCGTVPIGFFVGLILGALYADNRDQTPSTPHGFDVIERKKDAAMGLTDDISNAIVLYFGRGQSPVPTSRPEAVRTKYGDARGNELIAVIDSLKVEMGKIEIDWKTHSLSSGTDAAVEAMRSRHPELSALAFDSLGWWFSWVSR